MSDQDLTRTEALAFNPLWNDEDRETVAAVIAGNHFKLRYKAEVLHMKQRLDEAVAQYPARLGRMYRIKSNGYIRANDHDGGPMFWIRKGAIDFVVEGADLTAIHLSRVNVREERARRHHITEVICPRCNLTVPRTGQCDMCEWAPDVGER